MTPNANVFREAREIARHCIFPERRERLREHVDTCKEVFDRFNLSASREDFQELVGAWTRMLLAIELVGPWVDGPSRGGGAMPVPSNVDHGAKKASVG